MAEGDRTGSGVDYEVAVAVGQLDGLSTIASLRRSAKDGDLDARGGDCRCSARHAARSCPGAAWDLAARPDGRNIWKSRTRRDRDDVVNRVVLGRGEGERVPDGNEVRRELVVRRRRAPGSRGRCRANETKASENEGRERAH